MFTRLKTEDLYGFARSRPTKSFEATVCEVLQKYRGMKNSPDLLQSVEHNVREVCKTFGWHYPVKVVATCDLGQIDVQLKFRSDGESDRFWAHINSSIFPEPQCEEWFCAQCVTFFREHIDIKPYHADCGWVSETTKKQLMETTAPRQAHAGLG